jgi:hypothetical protein
LRREVVMAGSFAADLARFATETDRLLTDVWHESLRGLDQELAANVKVVSGNTRNSRAVSNSGPIATDFRTKKFRNPDDAINNAIAGAEIGGVAHLGFRAPWARKLEAKTAFVRLAAQKWQAIVAAAVRRAKGGA